MQVCVLVGDTYVRILLLLANCEEVCFCIVSLIWDRLAIFTLLLRAQVRPLVTSRFKLLQVLFIGYHLPAEVKIFVIRNLILIKADSKAALSLKTIIFLILVFIIILIIVFIVVALNFRSLLARGNIGISLIIKDRPVGFNILIWHGGCLRTRPNDTPSCHVEILELKLFYPGL